MSMKNIGRCLVHLLLPIRRAQLKFVSEFSKGISECKILEIGCGGKKDFIEFFETHNDTVQSDAKPYPGCEVLDVTELDCKNQYDVIIAINVLEHVYDYRRAITNIHDALRPNGYLVLSVPFFYPLHDLPDDYWRFTCESLRRELSMFGTVTITQSGFRWAPHSIHIIAAKTK